MRTVIFTMLTILAYQTAYADEYAKIDGWGFTQAIEEPDDGPFSCAITPSTSIIPLHIHLLKAIDEVLVSVELPATESEFEKLLRISEATIMFDSDGSDGYTAQYSDASGSMDIRVPRASGFLENFSRSSKMTVSLPDMGSIAINLKGSDAAADFLERCKYDHERQSGAENSSATASSISTNAQQKFASTNFPAKNYDRGPTRLPDFKRRDKKFYDFRTRITNALNAGPNFAGAFSLVQIGCGTGCTFVVVASNKTGEVFSVAMGGEEEVYLTLEFDKSSELLIAQSASYETQKCYIKYFRWTGRFVETIGTQLVGEMDSCYKPIRENISQ